MLTEKEPKQEGPQIEFPNDPEIVEKLRDKLEEYKSRLESEEEENKFQPPEISKPKTADIRYKIAVLEKVLDGSADTHSIARELQEQDGGFFDKATFENACGVIESYSRSGGKEVKGGTGLSLRKEKESGEEKSNEDTIRDLLLDLKRVEEKFSKSNILSLEITNEYKKVSDKLNELDDKKMLTKEQRHEIYQILLSIDGEHKRLKNK